MSTAQERGYRAGDCAEGYQWTGSQWVEAPTFPSTVEPPPGHVRRGRPARPWLALLASLFAAIVLMSVATVAVEEPAQQAPADVVPPQRDQESPAQGEQPRPAGFDPIVLRGSGDSVQRIAIPATDAGQVILTMQSQAGGYFGVWALDSALQKTDLAVNDSGPFNGSALVPATTAALDIAADGAWQVTVRPLSDARAFDGSIKGSGGAVLRYTGKQGIATIRSDGPITVWEQAQRGYPSLLLIEFGASTGQEVISAGPNVLIIEAEGDWEVAVR